jgi:hypothetical protein
MSISYTEISLDTRLAKDFLPPEDAPPPIINEENRVVAPWLVVEGDDPVRVLPMGRSSDSQIVDLIDLPY